MIKVLFCTDGIFPHMVGGMQRHSRLLVEALARTGRVSVTVIHPHPGIAVFEGMPGVEEIALPPLPGRRNYLLELRDYSRLVLAEARKRPDHILYSQGLSVWAGLSELAPRTIVNPHGLEPYQTLDTKTKLKTLPYRIIFDRIFRKAARTVSLGGHLSTILRQRMGRHASRIVVLPNATNPAMLPQGYHKQRGKVPRFLFAGRFADNKGIDYLMEASSILRSRNVPFQLDLVGKGPLWESLKMRFTLPELNFLGFVPDEDLEQLYLECDVFVLPTLFEGMPTVVLEAMARGMPVIVTDVGATLELVGPDNGIIIPKRDRLALANAMAKMADISDEEFEGMSQRSLEKFRARFTWDAVAEAHIRLFEELASDLRKG